MTQHADSQIQHILSLIQEIKSMVAAERRQTELAAIRDHLDRLDSQHDAIRDDIREVLMMVAQSQAIGAD